MARETKVQRFILIVEEHGFLCFFIGEFGGFCRAKLRSLVITLLPQNLIDYFYSAVHVHSTLYSLFKMKASRTIQLKGQIWISVTLV